MTSSDTKDMKTNVRFIVDNCIVSKIDEVTAIKKNINQEILPRIYTGSRITDSRLLCDISMGLKEIVLSIIKYYKKSKYTWIEKYTIAQ